MGQGIWLVPVGDPGRGAVPGGALSPVGTVSNGILVQRTIRFSGKDIE